MNCDPLARWYRWIEYAAFGRALERRRLEYIDSVSGAESALMLGDGDGRFLKVFLRNSPNSVVASIESSREMLALASARITSIPDASARVSFRHADARSFPLPSGAYDLITTHFFLDCFSTMDTADLISRIARSATPRAQWLISEFRLPDAGLARYWAFLLIRTAYFFFRITTGLEITGLPEYRDALRANGFTLARSRTAHGGLLISELWQRTAG
jgi:ubiquinone/menaquinone biosynthesis C-methylase UbiE